MSNEQLAIELTSILKYQRRYNKSIIELFSPGGEIQRGVFAKIEIQRGVESTAQVCRFTTEKPVFCSTDYFPPPHRYSLQAVVPPVITRIAY